MRPHPLRPAPWRLPRWWRQGLALLLAALALALAAPAAARWLLPRALPPAQQQLDPAFTRGLQSLQVALSWQSWSACTVHLGAVLDAWDAAGVALERRLLVVYHVGPVSHADPLAPVFADNVRLFFASLREEGGGSAGSAGSGSSGGSGGSELGLAPPFVLVNIVGGRGNALWEVVAQELALLAAAAAPAADGASAGGAEACAVEHASAESDLLTHLQSAALLGPLVTARLGSLAALNQGVRGPLPAAAGGGALLPREPRGLAWLSAYAALLHSAPEMALVGPLLSCQMAPHLQTHMFLLKADKLGTVLEHGLLRPGGAPPPPRQQQGGGASASAPGSARGRASAVGDWLSGTVVHLEVGLTDSLLDDGFSVASMHDHLALGRSAYAPTHCPHPTFARENPSRSCALDLRRLGFVKYGGELMRQDLLCPAVVAQVEALAGPGGSAV